MKIFERNKGKKVAERVEKSLGANPKRKRGSVDKATKGAKHGKGLTSSQRRKLAIKRAELEALRNPWLVF